MVDVEHHALRALEEHRLVLRDRLVQDVGGVSDQRRETATYGNHFGHRAFDVERFATERANLTVGIHQGGAQAPFETRPVVELAAAQARASGLIRVAGADAAQGGADLVVAARALVGRIHGLVAGQHQVRAVAHQQAAGGVAAIAGELVDFLEQRDGIDHHTVADDATGAFVQDARRQQVQHGLVAAHHHGVARVGAALAAHDEVVPICEQVDDLALALVTPLQAENDLVAAFLFDANCAGPHHFNGLRHQSRPVPCEG